MKEPSQSEIPVLPDPEEIEILPRAIEEAIPYGIWIARPGGDILYISRSFLDLTGMTLCECQQSGWLRCLHPGDVDMVLAGRARCITSGEFWNHEFRVFGTDGKYHTLQSRGMPIRDEEGKILLWAGVNLDVGGPAELRQHHTSGREKRGMRMQTLSGISRAIAREEGDLQGICQQVIAWMPGGFRHPDLVSPRITLGRVISPPGDDHPGRIVAMIVSGGVPVGCLEVEYRGSLPLDACDPFRPQERDFVRAIATMLGIAIAREEVKEALRSLERQHRLLSDQVPESIILLEAIRNSAGEPVDYRCIDINNRAREEIGYGRGDIIGKAFFELFPDCSPELRDTLHRVAETGTPEYCETYSQERDGHYKVRAYRPQCNQITLIADDITVQKKTEEALWESEEKYRTLTETARDAIVVHDTRSLFYANPAAGALFGVENPEDLVGLSLIDRVHPESRDDIQARMSEAIRGGILPLQEVRILRLDGSSVPVELSASSVSYNNMHLVLTTMRDVTRRRRIEAALRQSGERFRQIFDESPIGIEYYSPGGRLLHINRSSLAIHGVSGKQDMMGYNLFQDPNTPAWVSERLRCGEEAHYTITIDPGPARRGGFYQVYADVHANPVRDRDTGVLRGILVQIQNVTDHVHMEDLRQQAFSQIEKNIEQFAILADHIRLPLQVILGMADLIDDGEASERIRGQVERINDIVKQLDRGWAESREIREFLRRNELV